MAETRKVKASEKQVTTSSSKGHPTYEEMIKAAILSLKERRGSSRQAIKKYILANYNISPGAHFDTQIATAIKRGAAKNVFMLSKGLSGTVKLVKPEKTEKEPKDNKKSTAAAAADASKKPVTRSSARRSTAATKKTKTAPKRAQPARKSTTAKQNVKAPTRRMSTRRTRSKSSA